MVRRWKERVWEYVVRNMDGKVEREGKVLVAQDGTKMIAIDRLERMNTTDLQEMIELTRRTIELHNIMYEIYLNALVYRVNEEVKK